MKKIVAMTVVVVFAALLCQVAFCQATRPAGARGEMRRPPVEMTEEMRQQREEMRKVMERLREINQNEDLRALNTQARQDEAVQKAQEQVTKAREALNKAQADAAVALDGAVLKLAKEKGNEELIKLAKERSEIMERMRKFREQFSGFSGRGFRMPGAGGRPPRRGAGGPPAAE